MSIASIESPALDSGVKLLGVQTQALRDTIVRGIMTETDDYTMLVTSSNKLLVLGSATAAGKTFKFPDVGSADDGFTAVTLNNSDYGMTVKPFDSSTKMLGTGDGYGWKGTQKGCIGIWKYNHSDLTWYPVVPLGGGLWMVEGLKLWIPCTEITIQDADNVATRSITKDNAIRHMVSIENGATINVSTMSAYPESIGLNGVDERFEVATSADFDVFGNAIDDWTIFGRLYPNNTGAAEEVITQYEDANNFWEVRRSASDAMVLNYTTASSLDINLSAGTLVQSTENTFVVAKIAGEVGIYVNGVQVAYDNVWTPDTFTGALSVGQTGAGSLRMDADFNDIIIINQNIFNAAPNSTPDDDISANITTKLNLVLGGN